jgi:dTDP-4-amino-4,6-dideoxygalactose transaminase
MSSQRIPLVDLAAVHADLADQLEAAIRRVCRRGSFVGASEVAGFERDFADYLGVRHVVAVANGTDALELALRAHGIGAGDEVIVPANTFIATAEAAAATGAAVRFADVYPASGLLDPASCEERIGSRTRALIPVHLYGRVVEMEPVLELADRYDLVVVEDAAQAHGASADGVRAGAAGSAGCFSFYPSKNLGALGDGGALSTNDDELADRLRLLRDHGRRGADVHEISGHNSRMDEIQAAVLKVKLPYLDGWNERRRQVAQRYRQSLEPEMLDWMAPVPEAEVHHLFPILIDDRDRLAAELARQGIDTGVHYRHPLPSTPAFSSSEDSCSVAGERAARQLSLPMHPYLWDDDVEKVIAALRAFDPGPAALA